MNAGTYPFSTSILSYKSFIINKLQLTSGRRHATLRCSGGRRLSPRQPSSFNQRKGVIMSAAWFVDGEYLSKVWQKLNRIDHLDYVKLRQYLEAKYCDLAAGERIEDAYYFNANPDPPSARTNAYHNRLAYPPPGGPGLRVKLEGLSRKPLFWP